MKTLFLVLDTVRRDYLSCYGNTWVQTPNLQRLAQQGIVFDNHWVGSLPCIPARREMMTGRLNFLDRGWGPIEPFDDVLPRELRKIGVFSHLLTDHDHYFELGGENYHTDFNTWEFFRGTESDPWASLVDNITIPPNVNGKGDQQAWKNRARQSNESDFSGPRTAMAAVDWLRDNGKSAGEWFLQVELFDPHEPFVCTDKYREMYGDTWDGPLFDWPAYDVVRESPAAIDHIRKCYAGLLTMTDHWIGKILDEIDAQGLWDNLLVVFTTDHGTLLGEHEYWMKNHMPVYREIAQIPLLVCLPGGEMAGRRVNQLTQTTDLMPTFLDFHGATIPPHVQGHSLRAAMEGDATRKDLIFGYFGMATNITDGNYTYFRNPVNEDGGPLHAYTAMPVGGLNHWFSRELYPKIEMGRYLGHTYNLPLYKIPLTGQVPRAPHGAEPFFARHELFDLRFDPQQLTPLENLSIESHFTSRIAAHLRKCGAPAEQFARLGLDANEGKFEENRSGSSPS